MLNKNYQVCTCASKNITPHVFAKSPTCKYQAWQVATKPSGSFGNSWQRQESIETGTWGLERKKRVTEKFIDSL